MGMHHGILVMAAGFKPAVAALDARMPSVRMGDAHGSLETLDLEADAEGFPLAGGELDGQTYILDTSFLLSMDGDAIVDLSRELGCVVAGCGGETTSGSFWFYAADRGALLRAYSTDGDMSAPWSKGEPLGSEPDRPLDHLDGEGMIAALASLGFDYERWASGTQLRNLVYELGDDDMPSGPLAAQLEAFRATVEIPKGKRPKPTVVSRDGGFDLAKSTPSPLKGDGAGDPGGLFGFVRRLLGAGGSSAPTPLPGTSPSRSATPPTRLTAPQRPSPPPRPLVQPKPPTIADLPPGRKHFYVEYVGGASSKFYAVSLEEEAGGTWRVRFNYGRIGFPRAWDSRVEGATWRKASTAYMALIDEKLGKGYEPRPWPVYLQLPDGGALDAEESAGAGTELDHTLFRATSKGTLPPERGGTVAGVVLPAGTIYVAEPEGGNRGESAAIWASDGPIPNVGEVWARLAAAFHDTGFWPVVIDAKYGFDGFGEYLMDMPRGRHTEAQTILRRNWGSSAEDMDDLPPENLAPFDRTFPGLASPTPGGRATTKDIESIVASLEGHLGLIAVNRPADVLDAIGWSGAVNYDFDPLDMSTVLRSWEVRFDAYLVGLGTDVISLAVGRPPRDLDHATAIAAEHYAFCLDNIDQGPGSIAEYAPLLVDEGIWPFWWD